ncbi:hypothetical protein [Tabrizicola sp.]|uniref:hypothetical protein n=1 Tax=Tabrizicola sp. TaxID=2005166 RepID=UPI003F34DBEF
MEPGSNAATSAEDSAKTSADRRTVHLHLFDPCNAACGNCCTCCSEVNRAFLPLEPILQALPRLRDEGYQAISLRGGDPQLYPWLSGLLAAAKAEGFRTVVIGATVGATTEYGKVIEALRTDATAWDLALKGGSDQRLADIVSPLVVTPGGILRPYSHDFPEEFDLGRLQDLAPERRVWIACGLPRLRRLLAQSLHAAALEDGSLDWPAFLRDQSGNRERSVARQSVERLSPISPRSWTLPPRISALKG